MPVLQKFLSANPDFSRVAGVDEVGLGALAGPVVAAAVVLPKDCDIPGLTDSKKIGPKKRAHIAEQIRALARSYAVAFVSAMEVDRINVLQASLLAMGEAVLRLPGPLDHVLIDGNHCPDSVSSAIAIVGGDARVACISAASILAKEARDAWMRQCSEWEPRYCFEKHKGYPAPLHLELLRTFGPCSHHRMSYAPVRAAAESFAS